MEKEKKPVEEKKDAPKEETATEVVNDVNKLEEAKKIMSPKKQLDKSAEKPKGTYWNPLEDYEKGLDTLKNHKHKEVKQAYISKGKQIILTIGENGQVNFKTNFMKGYLSSVIIDSPEQVEVIVESSLGYLIFKRTIGTQKYFEEGSGGIEYIAPRIRIVPSDENMRDILPFDKFKLNEELLVTLIGMKNTDVKLIFRLD